MTTLKNKYDVLNYLNEKYDVLPTEVTCYEEINDFWNNFRTLNLLGRISKTDFEFGANICINY